MSGGRWTHAGGLLVSTMEIVATKVLPRLARRYILVSNHLPVKASRENDDAGWNFELDVDALVVQAKARPPASARLCRGLLYAQRPPIELPLRAPSTHAWPCTAVP